MSECKTINRVLLIETLERYGGDPARWPDDTRAGLKTLIADDPLAKTAMDEFSALDQLLTSVGDGGGQDSRAHLDALTEKIMQSVATPAERQDEDTVVPFEPVHQRAQSVKQLNNAWSNLAAAGALAASLVLGISIGATGIANTTLTPVSEALGLGSIATETAALSDSIFDVVDDKSFDDDVL